MYEIAINKEPISKTYFLDLYNGDHSITIFVNEENSNICVWIIKSFDGFRHETIEDNEISLKTGLSLDEAFFTIKEHFLKKGYFVKE